MEIILQLSYSNNICNFFYSITKFLCLENTLELIFRGVKLMELAGKSIQVQSHYVTWGLPVELPDQNSITLH